ncbi:MAG: diguanylate cyclase [Myxococcota bacterium]
MRILIAEDDSASRLLLRRSVEKLGYQCDQAEDGNQAWELFQEIRPNIIISDWMMPGRDGIQLCKAVREFQAQHYTYFIILTALDDKRYTIQALEAGVDDYLVKPLDRDELQARLIAAKRVTSLHSQLIEQKRELERLNAELFEDGRRDPLTRIGNRLRMQEDLENLAARAARYGHTFTVALCDIDFFKKYNDTCGHGAGDETLKAVARTLARYSRSGDSAYRYGGEEFLVVLPEQGIDGALIALERRRRAVERLAIPHPGRDPHGPVTISAGLAVFDASEPSPIEAVLKRADEALYLAKRNGRNRVATYPQVVAAKASAPAEPTPPTAEAQSSEAPP